MMGMVQSPRGLVWLLVRSILQGIGWQGLLGPDDGRDIAVRCDDSHVPDGVVLVVENERRLVALVAGVPDHALEMTRNIARRGHELDLCRKHVF